MGLTRQYLRYEASSIFGLIASQKSNIVYLNLHTTSGKYCAVGACEEVIVWDLRTGEKHATLHGSTHDVTTIASSSDKNSLAVGYDNGEVRVFDLSTGEATLTFMGHKTAVTSLQYNDQGVLLASGSKDTTVIVWDVVNECGLFRLSGHKGPITKTSFISDRKVLITSSKDTFIKFWDLDTQHCFKTLVGHRSEIYDFVVVRNGHRLITGSGDGELRVWDIIYASEEDNVEPQTKKVKLDNLVEEEEDDMNILKCRKVGSVFRQVHGRVVAMKIDVNERFLICQGLGKKLEVFRLPSDEELRKHLVKRKKKHRKKQTDETEKESRPEATLTLQDEINRLTEVTMTTKLVSTDMIIDGGEAKIVSVGVNNSIQYCSLPLDVKLDAAPVIHSLTILGHRSDVRTLAFSSDNTALLSASGDTLKIWNRASLQCIRTIPCEYALCSVFAPGDRHIVLGTKSGKLNIFDVPSGCLLESIDAHEGAVWSIDMAADKRGIISGSADHNVKFWNFELITDSATSTSKRLSLEHKKTLKMDEDVLAVKYSPDQRLIAVSLLDNTVKVFFADTLKFFLSLYGHKLPVLCLDISTDSTLLVTGSADRNVKIWGLDYGDCHKSIFAHSDSIMSIMFVPKTHMFFTGGKDGLIKEWDADKFEHIQTLKGHHAEIWCLSVSPSGNFLASASHDHSLRLWEKTQESLVLGEEREKEREKDFEESLLQEAETVIPGETQKQAGLAGKKTVEKVRAAERIMEAIVLYKEEKEKEQIHSKSGQASQSTSTHPLLKAMGISTPEKYMLEVLRRVKSSELEEALLVLPFSYVIDLLKILSMFIEQDWQLELSFRCLFFLTRVHHGQIISSRELLPVVEQLRNTTTEKVDHIRDRIGFNLAGLQFLENQLEQKAEVVLFTDATDAYKEKKKKTKKKAILSLHV